MSNKGEIS